MRVVLPACESLANCARQFVGLAFSKGGYCAMGYTNYRSALERGHRFQKQASSAMQLLRARAQLARVQCSTVSARQSCCSSEVWRHAASCATCGPSLQQQQQRTLDRFACFLSLSLSSSRYFFAISVEGPVRRPAATRRPPDVCQGQVGAD